MPSFQIIVLILAVIILIVALSFIGVSLKNSNKKTSWPPLVADCPDYWTVDVVGSSTVCRNVKDLGKCKSLNDNPKDFTGLTACQKYTWADSCDVAWDGITYGVKNPCDIGLTTQNT
jgi:hypothetical protein